MLPLHAQSKLPILPAVSPRLVLRQHGAFSVRLVTRLRNSAVEFVRALSAPHGTVR